MAKVAEELVRKKSFEEEAKDCISVEEWCNELRKIALKAIEEIDKEQIKRPS